MEFIVTSLPLGGRIPDVRGSPQSGYPHWSKFPVPLLYPVISKMKFLGERRLSKGKVDQVFIIVSKEFLASLMVYRDSSRRTSSVAAFCDFSSAERAVDGQQRGELIHHVAGRSSKHSTRHGIRSNQRSFAGVVRSLCSVAPNAVARIQADHISVIPDDDDVLGVTGIRTFPRCMPPPLTFPLSTYNLITI